MSETLRDRLILCIPWIICMLAMFAVDLTWPSLKLAGVDIGLVIFVSSVLEWCPPFQKITLRQLRRTYPKYFRPRERPSPKASDVG